jgi:hypothetical protein
MSAFRFTKPTLPRRMVLFAGYGLVAVITLIGVILLSGTSARNERIAEMEAVIARADAAGQNGPTGTGLPPSAFHTGDTPQLAQALLQTNLQNLAETESIDIDVIRTEQIEQIDGFVRLNLTVNGVAPETELGTFLHGLSVLEPIVVVEQIALRRARSTRTNPQRRISFQIQLYGVSER